jgi:ABC-type dipeptide/oligopeptide/nickel transport system permease component
VARYIARRLVLVVPQMFLILFITFFLVRMLPGDPALLQLGPFATKEGIATLRADMRLDEPWPAQFVTYLARLAQGDFGQSWVTGSSVADDLAKRIPATLELIAFALLVILLVLLPLGVVTASRGGGLVARSLKKLTNGYGLLAGALPDFWLGLILIFVFFTTLGIAPGPEGRISIRKSPPSHVTGSYVLDSILTANGSALIDVLSHLVLPVLTLAFVYGAVVFKTTRVAMEASLRSDYTTYAEAIGLPRRLVLLYAFRASAPPVILMTGITFGYMLGGAVLVETVFNLNGIGQYAVQSVVSSDYAPIQGFVLFSAVFTMSIYLVVDLLYVLTDPRVRIRGRPD